MFWRRKANLSRVFPRCTRLEYKRRTRLGDLVNLRPNSRLRRGRLLPLLLLLVGLGCDTRPPLAVVHEAKPPSAPQAAAGGANGTLILPAGAAGDVLRWAIDSAGGWEQWQKHRDASFISTMTMFDPQGHALSETIFLHKLPLHRGMRTRLESIGLPEELVFGFDGQSSWLLRDGELLTGSARTAFTTFYGVSALYWFGLPFIAAESQAALTYEGTTDMGWRVWDRVRVDYRDVAAAPMDWIVLYVDRNSGVIDQVHCQVRTEFLDHHLWIGKWRDYREYGGIKRERRRTFFPANSDGEAVGMTAAEQIIEHVRFDNDFDDELFVAPPNARGGNLAG